MRKSFLAFAACALLPLCSPTASATANNVYHEQSGDYVAQPVAGPGLPCAAAPDPVDEAGGVYADTADLSPSSPAPSGTVHVYPGAYTLRFKIEFQTQTNQARVFYTTDGTAPTAVANGTGIVTPIDVNPAGTTKEVAAAYTYAYRSAASGCQTVDIAAATIPAQPAGTTVRYVIAAWNSGGGDVVYANSGACPLCNACTTSACATTFGYTVVPPPPPLVISEFRFRGAGGEDDEYVEIYNNSESEVVVNAFDGSAGFALAASDGTPRFVIPNGTRMPGRGHFLGVNSNGYTLASYPAAAPPAPAGGGPAAAAPAKTTPQAAPAVSGRSKPTPLKTSPVKGLRPAPRGAAPAAAEAGPAPKATAEGDVTYTTGIADNAGIALFYTANEVNFGTPTRLDAVGSTSEANTDYKEGAGYPAITPRNAQFAFFRDYCGKSGSLTTFGGCARSTPMDTGDNATDFVFVEPNGLDFGAGARLGAPGPENSSSPIQRTESLPDSAVFPCVSRSAPPNRVRNLTSDPTGNSTFGTLSFRLRVTNSTNQSVTRLRFRVVDLTTSPAPGTADLRPRTSTAFNVTTDPCTNLVTPVQGTTLEQPPNQTSGGGFNSTLSAGTVTPASPILPGGTYDFQLLVGVQQPGRFKFYVIIEVLP